MDVDNEHKKKDNELEDAKTEVSDQPKLPIVNQDTKPHRSFNKYFLYTLVAGLVVSALISVIAVLIGEFNSTMTKALATTASMVIHAIIALFLVSLSGKSKDKVDNFFLNTLLLITILSFITSILGTWEVITGRWTADLYAVYFYTFWASLWIQLLLKIGKNQLDKPTVITSYVAIAFTALFYLLVVPTIFVHYPNKMPEFYYRVMAASVILLATTSVLTTVFRRIFIFKHHDTKSASTPNQPWDIILAIFALVLGVPIILALVITISSYGNSSYTDSSYDQPVVETTSPSVSPSSSPEKVFPKSKINNTFVDCSKRPGFESPKVSQYSPTYTFVSQDIGAGEYTFANQDDGTVMKPVSADKIVLVVDSSCDYIRSDALESGDNVKLYLQVGYTNFYKNALVYVQKLN